MLQALNAVRAAHGLQPLRIDIALTRAARSNSSTMMRRGTFEHGNLAARLTSAGARGPLFGENLSWTSGGRATATAIVRDWLASPPHRANLLRPGFRRIGVGAMVGAFAGYPKATVVAAAFAGV